MEFRAYGYNLRKEDYKTIEAMVKVVTSKIPFICDIRSYEIESNSTDVLFLFGARVIKECKSLDCKIKLEFPDISKLDAGFGEEEERDEAFSKLINLQKVLHKQISTTPKTVVETYKLSEESLPTLNANEILALEETLKKQGVTEWKGITKNGVTICLSWLPGKKDADINLTFAELYALKVAMETLQVEEFEIVRRTSS